MLKMCQQFGFVLGVTGREGMIEHQSEDLTRAIGERIETGLDEAEDEFGIGTTENAQGGSQTVPDVLLRVIEKRREHLQQSRPERGIGSGETEQRVRSGAAHALVGVLSPLAKHVTDEFEMESGRAFSIILQVEDAGGEVAHLPILIADQMARGVHPHSGLEARQTREYRRGQGSHLALGRGDEAQSQIHGQRGRAVKIIGQSRTDGADHRGRIERQTVKSLSGGAQELFG